MGPGWMRVMPIIDCITQASRQLDRHFTNAESAVYASAGAAS
jgi:hypothetical protein